jgi:type IV fimbrial biogenesis protein FimT
VLKRHARQRGFSLIELMFTVTIFGLVLMLGLPSFSEWIQTQQLRAATEATLNGLQVARAEAIRRNLQVQIVFGPPGTSWTVTEVLSAAPVQSRPAAEGSANAVLALTPVGATTVTFTPLGSVTTNADASAILTQLDITNPTGGNCQPAGPMRCLRVLVTGGGSLKMCDPIVVAPDARACS